MALDDVERPGAARIRSPKTSEILADKIRAQIVRGELNEGDFLPPEGQLMDTLGLSRPTLREAFRILEAEGLISVVRGSRSGARVRKPSVELVSRYAGYVLQSQATTIADLYQTRALIEPSVVHMLATSKDKAATDKLRKLLAHMSALLDEERDDDFVEYVEVFHQSLVAASGLKTLTFLNRMLLDLAAQHQRDYARRHPEAREKRRKNLRAALKSYEKLVTLIEAGSIDEAVAHWQLHIKNANATWAERREGSRIVDALGA